MDNTDKLLNKIISVLLFTVLLIMLTIGSIFFMPPSFAYSVDDLTNLGLTVSLNEYSTYSNGTLTLCGSTPFRVDGFSAGDVITFSVSFTERNTTNTNLGYIGVWNGGNTSNTFSVTGDYEVSSNGSLVYIPFNGSAVITYTVGADDSGLIFQNCKGTKSTQSSTSYSSTSVVSDLVFNGNNGAIFSAERTITIQPGYVAYIETYGGTLDIIAQFPMLSRLSRPLWDNSVQIAFGVFAPVSGSNFTFTNNFGSPIDWLIPASAPTNILGQSKVGGRQFTAGLPDNGSSVAIYNPAYSGVSSNSNDYGRAIKAPVLTVTISNCVFVEWYKLRTDATISVQSGPAIIANSDDNFTSSVIYMPDEYETDTIVTEADCQNYNSATNTTSAGVTMNAGGSNYGTDDVVESANNLFSNLEQKLFDLLSKPVGHITNLINNATSFFTEIIHFFDWLPPEVRSVIVSCLALIPIIGFIKLLF